MSQARASITQQARLPTYQDGTPHSGLQLCKAWTGISSPVWAAVQSASAGGSHCAEHVLDKLTLLRTHQQTWLKISILFQGGHPHFESCATSALCPGRKVAAMLQPSSCCCKSVMRRHAHVLQNAPGFRVPPSALAILAHHADALCVFRHCLLAESNAQQAPREESLNPEP